MLDVMPFPWKAKEFYIADGGGVPQRFTAVTTTSRSPISAGAADVVFLKHLKGSEHVLVDVEPNDLVLLEKVYRAMRE